MKSAMIPTQWKDHCIIPVFKSADKTSVSNCRPISLLYILSELLERIVCDYHVSCAQQFYHPPVWFLTWKVSTILFVNSIIEAKQHKQQMDVIYMDFSKVFDSVPHRKLLQKLESIGISGNLLSWFRFYLTSQRQCVRVGKEYSTYCDVLFGVPQGSILGPLLFVIYINELPNSVLSSIPHMFADDTKCIFSLDHNS